MALNARSGFGEAESQSLELHSVSYLIVGVQILESSSNAFLGGLEVEWQGFRSQIYQEMSES